MDVLCSQLVLSGVPVWRSAWALQPKAGNQFGRGVFWTEGKPVIDQEYDHDELVRDRFQQSPFRVLLFGGEPIRRRLLDPDCPMDFPILDDLRPAGATDYVALPVRLMDGRIHATTWSTKDDFGFDNNHIAMLEAVNDQMALLFELWEATDRS